MLDMTIAKKLCLILGHPGVGQHCPAIQKHFASVRDRYDPARHPGLRVDSAWVLYVNGIWGDRGCDWAQTTIEEWLVNEAPGEIVQELLEQAIQITEDSIKLPKEVIDLMKQRDALREALESQRSNQNWTRSP